MLVLHGSVFWPDTYKKGNGPGFFVWGEEMPEKWVGTRRRSRRVKPDLHPFVAPPPALAGALGLLAACGREEEGKLPAEWHGTEAGYPEKVLTVLLPTSAGWPLPSPLLPSLAVAEEEKERPAGKIQLAPWLVRGLVLTPAAAAGLLPVLCRSAGGTRPDGLAAGPDLVYWSRVAVFTRELLVRQRFVPVLDEDLRAGWRIVPGPEETGPLSLLAAAMPPVCRALTDGRSQEPSGAGRLVRGFVQAAGDGLITGYLAAHSRERPTSVGCPRVGSEAEIGRGSTHERWLAALVSGVREVNVPTEQLKSLAARLAQWARPVLCPARGAGLKTCFRLSPPGEDPDRWGLAFFLQAVDDPGFAVPAKEVWREESGTRALLERRFENPAGRLLADLAVAGRLFPPLARGLDTSQPESCLLSLPEAYRFLKYAAPLFEENGLAVQVPAFGREEGGAKNLGVRLKLKPRSSRKDLGAGRGLLGLDALVDFQWELALGGESLSVAEFRRLAALKVPLVQLRGQWVELNPAQAEETLRLLDGKSTGPFTLRDGLRTGFGPGGRAGLPVLEMEAAGWLGDVLDKLKDPRQIAVLPPPEGFRGRLRPYQLRGFSWLRFLVRWELGACLADDMGLGKTIQTIALLLHRREEGKRGPVLLVCPTSVAGTWEREMARFAPELATVVHHGPGRWSGDEFTGRVTGLDLVITSYTIASRDVDLMAGVDWAGVILDEAQNIKNAGAQRTRGIKRLPAGFKLALTGTPVENRLSELWSILDFLNPGLLGSALEFREKFALPIERYRDEQKARQLKALVGPFILRRLKTDPHIIADLPAKQESRVYCSLTREQIILYGAVVQDMLERIGKAGGIERRGLVLAAMTKLKQICNHPAQLCKDGGYAAGRSGKLARLTEMLEELLASGQAALVFTQFAQMGEILRFHLHSHFGREILFLHGGVPRDSRERLVARFQSPGGPPILVASLKAGGVGLNLTRANHVFHFDRWWNPAVEDQATDRAYRIGQKQNVFVYKFICSGTLEERVDELIEEKRHLSASVIGTGEDWLTGLSTDELGKVLALDATVAVED